MRKGSTSATRLLAAWVLGMLLPFIANAADTGSGTIDYKGRVATLKYAWLVTGPSDMEPGKQVRRLILSATDIGGKLQACKTFSCTDGEVTEGMTVDFTGGPRLNYWVALNGQKVQYSGTARPETFSAKANDATHLAGQLAIDDAAAGGPKVNASFDVTVTKDFKVAR
ncbi:MAG: hypothetical protein U1F48_18465 [Burkholderiales bacterium]